jgi:hypothetical protein
MEFRPTIRQRALGNTTSTEESHGFNRDLAMLKWLDQAQCLTLGAIRPLKLSQAKSSKATHPDVDSAYEKADDFGRG